MTTLALNNTEKKRLKVLVKKGYTNLPKKEKKEAITFIAKDFSTRFEGVMKKLANA